MELNRRAFLRASAVAVATPVVSTQVSGVASARHSLQIVEDGQPRAVVLVKSDAGDQIRYAADLLVDYVHQATGATLPLLDDGEEVPPGHPTTIHVGYVASGAGTSQQEVDALGQDGHILRTSDDQFTIVGRDGWGTRYGVFEFLERYVDVRWLMPDNVVADVPQIGRDVPQRSSLSLSRVDVSDAPAFVNRGIDPLSRQNRRAAEEWDWQPPANPPWMRLQWNSWGTFARLRHTLQFSHNLYNLIPPEVYGDPTLPTYRPDFFPLIDGEHAIPDPLTRTSGWQPRFSAEGIADVVASTVLEDLRANPDWTSYSLAVNDGRRYSEDDEEPDKHNHTGFRCASEKYYTFVNAVAAQVAAEFPHVRLGVLAYSEVADPPSFALHPNVIPVLARPTYAWVRDDVRQRDQQWVQQWRNVASGLGWWDYAMGNPFCVPRMYLATMRDAYQFLQEQGVISAFGQLRPGWGEGPKGSVYASLMWDPDQDVERLVWDWCESAVGRLAAPYLATYYRLWERLWTEDMPNSEWFDGSQGTQYGNEFRTAGYLEVVSESDVALARRFIERASARTETPEQAERMAALAKWNQYYEASALTYPKRTTAPADSSSAIQLIDHTAARLDRDIDLATQRLGPLRDALFPDPTWAFPPERFNLTWTGWNLFPVWDLAEYIREHESGGGPVRTYVEEMFTGASSENVRQLARWVLALADGEHVSLGDNMSFEDGVIEPWSLPVENSGTEVVDDVSRSGSRSLRVPARLFDNGGPTQTVDVEAGFYRFQAHIYAPEAISIETGSYVQLWTGLRNPEGDLVNVLQKQFALQPAVDDWYQVAQTEVLGTDVATADCSIAIRTEVPVYVDDVAIVQLPAG